MSSIGNKEIDARYITKKLLKTNAKSSVYLVTDKVLNRDLVIKKVRKDFNNETNSLPREASIMVSLDHPNLPKIYDVKEDEDFIYTIEEFIDGEDLRTLVGNEGPLDQDTVIKWGITLCNIMEYLHSKGIIYRDMKPGNIMLTPTGNIKLIDFDTARNYKEGAGEDTTHLGTVGYAAPEQFETKKMQSDERTDIYGIGVTLFNLLTDVDPKSFKGNVFSIRTIFPELSSGLDRIIIKCTERDPDNRYQTMGELKKALLNYNKYDVQYVIKKKKLLRKFYTYLGIGVVSLLIALGLGITNKIINSNSYDELIAGTPTIAEIEKAISIKPNDERAFSLMLDSFGEEITRDEMSLFSRNYSKAKTQMGKDVLVEVSMKAGERILSSYEEESDRAKLITSYPYFEEVKNNASKSYEKYDAALIYCNMTEFYKDYIMQNNAMIIKEPDKAAHEELLNEIKTSIEIADSYEGQEAKSLALSLYSISLSLIENESNACYEEGIEEEALTSIVEDIKERTNKISSELTVMKERKEKVLKLCESTEKKIESAYGKHKEER